MTDIILAIVILALVGFAVRYIYKAHKRGVKCIGCPAGCSCSYKNKKGACCSEKN